MIIAIQKKITPPHKKAEDAEHLGLRLPISFPQMRNELNLQSKSRF